MTITVQQLRADFPEFSSTTDYTNAAIQFWLDRAYEFLNVQRWGKHLDLGAELFTAHNIAIEARAVKDASHGGIPGSQVGPLNSKSIDKVSVSYDVGSGIELDAGHWNLTVYGTRFIRIARMMGAGPLQIGIGSVPTGSGQAWPGPDTTPGFTNFGN